MVMTVDPEYEKVKLKRAEELKEAYKGRVRELGKEICYSDLLGPAVVMDLFKEQVAEAEQIQTNALTTSLYLDDWVKNFRDNIDMIRPDAPFFGDVLKIKKSAIVVGAGPSLTDEQIEFLKNYKGTIICVNKSLERLLEHGVTPRIVVAIHSTDEILCHFQNDVVEGRLKDVNVIISSTLSPNVTKEIYQWADHDKLFWFHANVPDNIVPNMNTLLSKMVPLEVIDTGGNVGLMGVQVAQWCGAKTIAIVGMEHCIELSKEWTNSEALNYNIIYAPEDDIMFALTPVMRAYLQVLHSWYMNNRNHFEIFNLTPNGLFYVRRKDWMPYKPMHDFVREFD
jgi:hypothetical protein